MNALTPYIDLAFDLLAPLADRADWLLMYLYQAASADVQEESTTNPDAPWLPQLEDSADDLSRRDTIKDQEIKRRVFKLIQDLRQISNMLELRWAIDNGHETWIDAGTGEPTSLLEELEHQMPNEEERASSGRARQVWSFLDTAQAFRDQGISDQRIAECGKSGLSSVYGMTATAQRKLADVTPQNELRAVYEKLIDAAARTSHLNKLEKQINKLINPTDEPPPSIPYSAEPDGDDWWLVAHPSAEQFTELILKRLKDVLELDKQLPEWFTRYWRQETQ